jgi:hypothetical protein
MDAEEAADLQWYSTNQKARSSEAAAGANQAAVPHPISDLFPLHTHYNRGDSFSLLVRALCLLVRSCDFASAELQRQRLMTCLIRGLDLLLLRASTLAIVTIQRQG